MNYLITGTSSGIGAQIAIKLTKLGHNVIGIGRREGNLRELEISLKNEKGNFSYFITDLSLPGAVSEIKEHYLSKYETIDCIIANAGYSRKDSVFDLKYDDYVRQIKVNALSVIELIYSFLGNLEESKGSIFLIGSFIGERGLPTFAPYAMSKSALHAFAESSYWDFERKGIALTLVIPGFVSSDIRNRDHNGNYRKDIATQRVSFLEMETSVVAEKIVQNINKKKRRVIIGFHTHLLLIIFRFFPFVINTLLNLVSKKKS